METDADIALEFLLRIDFDQNKCVIQVIGWITRDLKLCAPTFLFQFRLLSKLFKNVNIGIIVNIGDMNSEVEKVKLIV